MNAKISYKFSYQTNPWDKRGGTVWVLMKVVTSELGTVSQTEPVTYFPWDSEALLFMEQVMTTGLDGKLVVIPDDTLQMLKSKKSFIQAKSG